MSNTPGVPLAPGATPVGSSSVGGTRVGGTPASVTRAASTPTGRAPSGTASSPALFTGAASRNAVRFEHSMLVGIAGLMLAWV
jgi:hypothetical protein